MPKSIRDVFNEKLLEVQADYPDLPYDAHVNMARVDTKEVFCNAINRVSDKAIDNPYADASDNEPIGEIIVIIL